MLWDGPFEGCIIRVEHSPNHWLLTAQLFSPTTLSLRLASSSIKIAASLDDRVLPHLLDPREIVRQAKMLNIRRIECINAGNRHPSIRVYFRLDSS